MSQEMLLLWNAILSLAGVLVGLWAKEKSAELARIGILLNKTREEVARDHITRAEVHRDLEKIAERFEAGIERLESKIDQLRKETQR